MTLIASLGHQQPIAESLVQVLAVLLMQLYGNVYPGRQQPVAQVLKSLPRTQEICIEL